MTWEQICMRSLAMELPAAARNRAVQGIIKGMAN
jgi:hypothetical protein